MGRRRITDEMKAQIVADYQNPDILTTEIRKKYNVNGTVLKGILDEAGVAPRSPKLYGSKRGSGKKTRASERVCPKCKREIANREARFCWYCGSDVRSEKQILIERLEGLVKLNDFIPAVDRDEYVTTLLDTIKELKK